SLFSINCALTLQDTHPFPTRRSSDLYSITQASGRRYAISASSPNRLTRFILTFVYSVNDRRCRRFFYFEKVKVIFRRGIVKGAWRVVPEKGGPAPPNAIHPPLHRYTSDCIIAYPERDTNTLWCIRHARQTALNQRLNLINPQRICSSFIHHR